MMVVGLLLLPERGDRMHRFFVEPSQVEEEHIEITGSDVNHIHHVLRMSEGDTLHISDGEGQTYECAIESLTNNAIRCKIQSTEKTGNELPVRISLFQGTPKQDKMEWIVQKCVELGVYDIHAVSMQRSIVRYDQKKESKKVTRWNAIAESAAKQSKRDYIPTVRGVLSWKDMLTELDSYDMVIVPYENERGMEGTRQLLRSVKPHQRIAVIIGPEGGFDLSEIEALVEKQGHTISLGNRILRTETAGMVFLAMISYQIEEV